MTTNNAQRIRDLYAAGATRKRIQRETQATGSEICKAVSDLPRRHQRLSREQIAIIQECSGTVREVAARLGVGKSSVFYWRQKVYDAWMAADEDTTPAEPTIEFQRLETPRRCVEHGQQNYWPCVSCLAAGVTDYE